MQKVITDENLHQAEREEIVELNPRGEESEYPSPAAARLPLQV
jgi:hypothetical protein